MAFLLYALGFCDGGSDSEFAWESEGHDECVGGDGFVVGGDDGRAADGGELSGCGRFVESADCEVRVRTLWLVV